MSVNPVEVDIGEKMSLNSLNFAGGNEVGDEKNVRKRCGSQGESWMEGHKPCSDTIDSPDSDTRSVVPCCRW